MKILLISHYFPPEIGAPSARLYEMAKYWVQEGHEVTVLTGFPNHPTGIIPVEYKGYKFLEEEMEGIRILRSYVYATPNEGFIKKTLGHVSFMFSAVIQSFKKSGKNDVIVVSSPTFFSIFTAYFYRIFKSKKFVLEIRDLWPAAIVDLGVLENKFIIKTLEIMELFFYRRAEKVVLVTNSFKQNLIDRGINPNKLEVVTNGVEPDKYNLDLVKRNELREEYNFENKFIVLYIGAHGISQSLHKIIEVAEQLSTNEDIEFVFVGEGADKKKLIDMVDLKKLLNVKFVGSQPKEKVSQFYSMADVCLVPLRDIPLFKTFIPSKMFEILSCERPIVASLDGESKKILEQSGGAIVTPPESVEEVRDAILYLKENPQEAIKMGKKGRNFVVNNYSRRVLAKKYLGILSAAAGKGEIK